MSIYVMTVGELAKKRGEPVGDFVKKVQAVGFDAGSHAKKLTQSDLDLLIGLLDNSNSKKSDKENTISKIITLENPNVLLLNLSNDKSAVLVVDATANSEGQIELKIAKQYISSSKSESLLEFRKQLGLNMGIN